MDNQSLAIVTAKTIEGVPSRSIAQAIGTSHTSVIRAQQKPDIKAIVEAGITKLIKRGLNPAVNTLCRAAAMGNTKSIKDTPDLYKLSVDASNKIIGHIQGSGPQTVINQLIYSQGARDELSTEALNMVNRALGLANSSDDQDVIDLSNTYDISQDENKPKS